MHRLSEYLPAMEGIRHQFNNTLYPELTEAVEELAKKKNKDTRTIHKCGLAQIIEKHTGLKFTITGLKDVINAMVRIPDMTRNNPILNDDMREYFSEKDSIAIIKEAKTPVKGSINLETGKVSGVWTTLKLEMYLGSGLFMPSLKMTALEIAGIILHEVGHVMSYIETLSHMIRTNYALLGLCQGIEGSTSVEERIVLLEEVDRSLGTDLEDKEVIAKSKKVSDYQLIILAEADRVYRNSLGNIPYDKISCEYLADEFAARHGASLHLVTGLDKMHRAFGSVEKYGTLRYLMACIIQLLAVMFFIYSFAFGPLIIMVMIELTDPIYDAPEARARRLREQLVERMRDPNVPKALRKQLDDEIKVLDSVLKTTKDRKLPLNFLVNLVRPKHRKHLKGIDIQKQLEDLANNELYVIHNRLIA